MTQFKLVTEHYLNDQLLPAGTIIGDDTDFPYRNKDGELLPPSLGMVGMDEESNKLVAEAYENMHPSSDLPEGPKQQDTGAANEDMTVNKPNPHLGPAPGDPSAAGSRFEQPTRTSGTTSDSPTPPKK